MTELLGVTAHMSHSYQPPPIVPSSSSSSDVLQCPAPARAEPATGAADVAFLQRGSDSSSLCVISVPVDPYLQWLRLQHCLRVYVPLVEHPLAGPSRSSSARPPLKEVHLSTTQLDVSLIWRKAMDVAHI